MKITLLVVGKTTTGYLKPGIDDYTARLGHYAPFDIQYVQDARNTRNQTEAPKPTGDTEKDAKACVDFMVQTIEETDFTDKAAQENLEKTMKSIQEEFETYYKERGEDAYKAFDEAGKKASKEIDLEELMMKKVMEAVKAAGVDLKDTPKEK